jgi:CubicO group peptidase (beta-lactamase class C family)
MKLKNFLKEINIFPFILLLVLTINLSCSQKETNEGSLQAKVDSIFAIYNNGHTPGAAVAILKNGEVIFKKGYGMANLEYEIPITPSSIFHIASVSKQFATFSIVLLAQEGKLSLDDEVRKYLPRVPDFGTPITIKQLMHHTSGLRDQWQLLAISGTRIDDVIKQEHVMKLLEKQEDLNFKPGDRHLYCNTGYTVLAEIVKEVSGQSLREFADERIFKPLGMDRTHFHDNYEEVVKERAYSYKKVDEYKFINSILSYSIVGATSLFSTVEDNAKWLKNFWTGEVGGKEAIDQMFELGVLNSGDTINYGLGLSIDNYKNKKRIGHGGADAGYRTYSVIFPEENLGIVVYGNVADFSSAKMAMAVADLFIQEEQTKSAEEEIWEVDRKLFADFKGKYHNEEGLLFEIVDSTNLFVKTGSGLQEMNPFAATSFKVFNGSGIITFNTEEKGLMEFKSGKNTFTLKKYEVPSFSDNELKEYEGVYRSREANTFYEIKAQDGKLILSHSKYEDIPLMAITRNQFSTPNWWMSNIIIKRNAIGKVTAFEVNSGRVLKLVFEKI